MEIEVSKAELRKLLGDAREEHRRQAVESLKLYQDKLSKYAGYVASLSGTAPDMIKEPPHLPSFFHGQISETIKMVDMHVGQTLLMQDHEYRSLIHGIESWLSTTSGAMFSLSTYS